MQPGSNEPGAAALVAVDDLFFYARIEAAVRAAGLEPVAVRKSPDLEAALARPLRVAIVSLGHRGLDALALIRRLKTGDEARPGRAAIPVLAFGSHVDVERLAAARAAGAEEVIPNSALTRDLAVRITKLAAGPQRESLSD